MLCDCDLLNYPPDLRLEAHVQHAVRLVQAEVAAHLQRDLAWIGKLDSHVNHQARQKYLDICL